MLDLPRRLFFLSRVCMDIVHWHTYSSHKVRATTATSSSARKAKPRAPPRTTAAAQSVNFSYIPLEKPSHPVVLALDIGTRNFAFCRMDARRTVLDWGVWDLVSGVPGIAQASRIPNIHTVRALVQSPLFRQVDHVVIENQVRGRMKLIEAYLQAFLYERATVVMPRAVHKHFATATGVYRANKAVAVAKVKELLENEKEIAFVESRKKRDDICDAYLLARYYQERLRHPHEADAKLLSTTTKKKRVKKG